MAIRADIISLETSYILKITDEKGKVTYQTPRSSFRAMAMAQDAGATDINTHEGVEAGVKVIRAKEKPV